MLCSWFIVPPSPTRSILALTPPLSRGAVLQDTVLTKCFHVFCGECIQENIDKRSRKCPQCRLAFGLKDFNRIYLT